MAETGNLLQRMRELAVQSANGTNSSSDRNALQDEVSQLQSEIDRIATSTEFNGQRILDGSFSNASFQVGSNANQTISFAIGGVKASAIGGIAAETGSEVSAAAATDITIAIGGGAACRSHQVPTSLETLTRMPLLPMRKQPLSTTLASPT